MTVQQVYAVTSGMYSSYEIHELYTTEAAAQVRLKELRGSKPKARVCWGYTAEEWFRVEVFDLHDDERAFAEEVGLPIDHR